MKEIQGKSTSVQVSEGSSYWESTVEQELEAKPSAIFMFREMLCT